MRPHLLVAVTLFAAVLAGCASRQPAPVAVAPVVVAPVASASAAGNVRTAQVVAVESASAGTSSALPSSGATGGTTVGSGATRLTLRFADGTESAYEVQQPATNFRVGEPLSVITNGSAITLFR